MSIDTYLLILISFEKMRAGNESRKLPSQIEKIVINTFNLRGFAARGLTIVWNSRIHQLLNIFLLSPTFLLFMLMARRVNTLAETLKCDTKLLILQ